MWTVTCPAPWHDDGRSLVRHPYTMMGGPLSSTPTSWWAVPCPAPLHHDRRAPVQHPYTMMGGPLSSTPTPWWAVPCPAPLHQCGRSLVGRVGGIDGGELDVVALGAATASSQRVPSVAALRPVALRGAAGVSDGGQREEAEGLQREGQRAHPAEGLQQQDGGLARRLHALRLQHGDGAVRQLRDDRQQVQHAQRHHQAPVAPHHRRPLLPRRRRPSPALRPAPRRAVQGPVPQEPLGAVAELTPLTRSRHVGGASGSAADRHAHGGQLGQVARHAADDGGDDEDGEDDEGDAGHVERDDGGGHGRRLGDAVHAEAVARPDDGGEDPERHEQPQPQQPGQQQGRRAEGPAAAGAAVEARGRGEDEAVGVERDERQEGDEGQGAVQHHPGHAEAARQAPGLQVEVDAEGVHHHAEGQVRHRQVQHLATTAIITTRAYHARERARTHALTHSRTHTHTHAHTHAHTHTHTRTHTHGTRVHIHTARAHTHKHTNT